MSCPILLVEGAEDREFFVALLKRCSLPNVEVAPPNKAFPESALGGGWTNVLKALPQLLDDMKQEDGPERLGVVIDADYADYPDSKGGFPQRYAEVAAILASRGYRKSEQPLGRGTVFEHLDGLPPVGLWIMPDHAGDGMLEDFLGCAVTSDQRRLFDHGRQAIANLPVILFNQKLHNSKALVSTWRAWQKKPGASLGQCVKDDLLDLTQEIAADFISWLQITYKTS
ncbi:MAG: DUF3226 domain-containing protein [Sulfuricellaceae bacterium]